MAKDNETPANTPKLLAGGNPQIPKGDGSKFVDMYLEAMPGWKQQVGNTLHTLILQTVPDVQMAVRWNTPFYGVAGNGWFMAYHCLTKYVKVSFFKGTSLDPVPPVSSKQESVRYFHIAEHDTVDEQRLTLWIQQASRIPGEQVF